MDQILKSRSRTSLTICLIVVAAIGLASRLAGGNLPRIISKDLGDVLWGLMFFLIVLLASPRIRTWKAATVAMILVSAIEFLKLYHASWIEKCARNSIGGLLLGRVFLRGNFVSYVVGVFAGVMGDQLSHLGRRR